MRTVVLLLLLPCGLACGPPSVASSGGDGTTSGEMGDADGAASESETGDGATSETGDADECPPSPFPADLTGCGDSERQQCPAGQKCGGYFGENCNFGNGFGGAACVPVSGEQALGEACTIFFDEPTPYFTWRLDDCDASGLCLKESKSDHAGICVPYCEWGPDQIGCEDPQRTCRVGPPSICQQLCDPTAEPQTCEGGLVCGAFYYIVSEFFCGTANFQPAEGQLGDRCWSAFQCANGLGCVAAELLPDCEHEMCCSPFCSLAEIDPCAGLGPGYVCAPFYDQGQGPPSAEHVGLCQLSG